MATNWPTKGGVNLVGEYQVSGHTYIVDRANTTRTINLKYLSNEVTVISEADVLEVEFTDGGGNARSVHLTKGSHTFRIKCKKIKFVGGGATNHSAVIACTGIPVGEYTPPNFAVLGD